MRHAIVVVLGMTSLAAAKPVPAARVGELVLSTNTMHSGVPGVRFGFGAEGEVSVDTDGQEPGGSPYPVAMRRPVIATSTADPKVAWYAADVAATPGCDITKPCAKKPSLFLTGTVLLEQSSGRWYPVAWHVAKPLTGKQQADELAAGKTLSDVPNRIDPGAEPVAKRFAETIGDPKAFAATISTRADTLMFGSSANERWLGGAAVSAQLAKWKLGLTVQGGTQAGITGGGKVAWVGANVMAAPIGKPKAKPTPYRVTAIYERNGEDWRVVQLHFSFTTNPWTEP